MDQGPRDVTAVVLAAGDGKRMRSSTPKVLHSAAGRPLLAHVLSALGPLSFARKAVVTSARRDEIQASMAASGLNEDVAYVVQDPPQGTGDAARVALEALHLSAGTVLIVPGDTPLITTETIGKLLEAHRSKGASATMLTARVPDPAGYGRVLRGTGGEIDAVVEHRDATEQQRDIDEVNAGLYVFDVGKLADVLGTIDRDNQQGEYYLTDVIASLRSRGEIVAAHLTDAREVMGVNSRSQLADAIEVLRRRACERWMEAGVTIIHPATTYIDAGVSIGQDAVIHPFTFLAGETSIAEGAEIGPQARIVDSEVGPGATVAFAVVRGSFVGPEASVGPFASLRPGTRLERGAHVGTFVETKQTVIGEGSKAPHLSYLGDAEIGREVNVGAGSITCNWDGRRKHKTVIDDEAYIGSDTMLVAPAHVGKRAATGAGAVVRGDVPDEALAIGVPARIIEGGGNRMTSDEEVSGDATAGTSRSEEEPRQ